MTIKEAIERLQCMRLFMEINDKQNDSKFLEDDYIANEMAIEALEEIQQCRAIGTVEEFKALKEKNVAKKVVMEHIPKTSWTKEVSHYLCPSCRGIFSFGGKPYCSNCGQKIDWQ